MPRLIDVFPIDVAATAPSVSIRCDEHFGSFEGEVR
jgi:hypothetical protein